jgi:hypothetical protein
MSSLCSVPGTRSRLVWRLILALALVVLAALALCGTIDLLQSGALTMVPALALALLMLTRPYLGERAIARLRTRRMRAERTVGPRVEPPRRDALVARGGRLIAAALAGRAPPLALASR